MLFKQFLDDDLGCASYLIGDEQAGIAASSIRALRRPCTSMPRGKRRQIELCSRRTRTPTMSQGMGASPRQRGQPSTSTARHSPTTSTSPSTTAGSSSSAADGPRDAYARPPPRAHRILAHRHLARPRAMAGAHRRLALRRRRRPADLAVEARRAPERASSTACARLPSCPTASRSIPDMSQDRCAAAADELEGLDDDRLREAASTPRSLSRAKSIHLLGAGSSARGPRTWSRSSNSIGAAPDPRRRPAPARSAASRAE